VNIDLPPQYDPKSVEAAIYQQWLDGKYFHANAPTTDAEKARPYFSIVIPPPNVTGALHLGHAINGTVQDILIRYHRMKGDNTLWMPGIDHAGIATQAVVEKTIFEKEKKNRHDLGREELVRRIWEWKEQFGSRIINQQEQLGVSCDWERTRFTLDDICAKAVREAFFKMFKDGLIFRGKRLVNWDTHLQTAVADDEIYYETVKGQMTSIRYPIADEPEHSALSTQHFLVVATTRPETMLGDTALAVHPDDPRYTHLHGKHVIVPLIGRRIPIITDGQLVDPTFGTGVVKVTPAHDPNDYATGQRHNLEQINLLTPDGKMNESGAGTFMGKPYSYVGLKFATAARKQILADLEELGLIADKKPHDHEVGHSDRSKTPIEPYLSDQWFVRMGDIGAANAFSESRPSASGTASTSAGIPDQPTRSETRPLGSVNPPNTSTPREAEPTNPHSNALAYFLTFHTYATWLHGEEAGSVDPDTNAHGTPFVPPDPQLLQRDRSKLSQPPIELTLAQRQSVLATLREVAQHRGWTIHAANVRSTHVHAVVGGAHAPERMLIDFKSYATRRLTEAGLIAEGNKTWSRHGSTRHLWKSTDIANAMHYTLHAQGANAAGTFLDAPSAETLPNGRVSERLRTPAPQTDQPAIPSRAGTPEPPTRSETRPLGSVDLAHKSDPAKSGITLADGTRAPGLAQAAMDAVSDGRVKITPERYAKSYLDWLGQKRDWCISRQLWWGHRIPVWRLPENAPIPLDNNFWERLEFLRSWIENNRIAAWLDGPITSTNEGTIFGSKSGSESDEFYICVRDANDVDVISAIEKFGFIQDPDVLDTWFSSALWPISTMGWPATGTSPAPQDQLLPAFYPTSVLSTAREILTLWVARMVIFGLYCHGDVPFKDVYIHAVIQDGEGRPMKKSLGNGVDPVEIVQSHGADALRYTLASMATETQDIRLPVVKDPKTGNNTSPKFDIGRNFANKIWNASRFILSNVSETTQSSVLSPHHLEDRWILSRLNTTITTVENAISAFRFADIAEALRTFFWTDLCDWYLEIAKTRIKSGDATVQSILLHCLETSLKLLHPMMPFITETIWSKLPPGITTTAENTPSPGIATRLSSPKSIPGPTRPMLIAAPWPKTDHTKIDHAAEIQITTIQSITSAIREIQNRYPAAKGKDVILQPRDAAMQATIEQSRSIIEPLAGVKIAENTPTATKPENAATAVLPHVQIFIGGVIDKSAESAKLTKRKEELLKFITAGRAKLGNDAAVSKVPANVVQGWRDQLTKQEEEFAAIEKNLAELGG
jgi:valyl-tRNA synthetase